VTTFRGAVKITALKILMAFFLVRITMPVVAQSSSVSFDGNWSFLYSCERATGVYADRCAQGERDAFALYDLTQEAGQICGYHLATGHLGDRVDEGDLSGAGPSVYGTVRGNVAIVHFRSTLTGEVGKATITRTGDTLVWHVVQSLKGESWFPDGAVLSRDNSMVKYRKIECTASK
jgi:hypothetical protein